MRISYYRYKLFSVHVQSLVTFVMCDIHDTNTFVTLHDMHSFSFISTSAAASETDTDTGDDAQDEHEQDKKQ